ncbi:MAG: CPBP family intramembrane metalloprotease [bacterium]|nr:hypothetical protein [Deltaproteobacteria bacterium]MCP4904038.1 CPBP family intramembrane metalloprotease [bacterium]
MMNSQQPDPSQPYPSVRGALMLTLMAMIAAGFTGIAFIDFGLLAAVGIGQAIGVGAVATMGAQRVPEPQAQRLGLRGLDLEAIPLILCLVPAVLLASELDNIATDFSDADSGILAGESAEDPAEGESERYDYEANDAYDIASGYDEEDADESAEKEESLELIDRDDPASILQAFVVMVGISPIVEEFLFRGVIQQGIVQRLGLVRGVSVVALLWTLLRPAPIAGFSRFLAAVIASFALGWALGIVRIATRSILGPILLASGWAAIGLAAIVLEGRIELPGMNVSGTHLPVLVTLTSAILVAWAGRTVFLEAQRRFAAERDGERHPPESIER